MENIYKCYDEIVNQADAWQEVVDVVLAMSGTITEFFDKRQPNEIIFTGCTSPYYAGLSSAVYWQSATGIHTKAVTSSELIQFPSSYYSTRDGRPVLVVLSRSGKTTETIWAVEKFEEQFPGRTLLIGCNPNSPLETIIPMSIMLPKGYEDSIPQTRSFSVMYLSALMIGAIISGQHKLLEELKNAPNIVKSVIQNSESIIKKINSVSDFQNIFFLGSGPLYGIACEATLKMMEMTISNTISVPFLESRHGPRSLIDEKSLVIGLYSNAGIGYEAKVMDELTLNHNATTVALNPNSEWETGNCTYKISINSKWPDYILGLAYLPVIQLLAFYRAMAKGVNPDTSRYLTQYIEIEKV